VRTRDRRWIGVDGEGVGRDPHRYVLLACSDGDYIEDRNGLSTVDCLNFLLKLGTRDARVCGYVLSYDWTMILADMKEEAILRLFRPELRSLGSHFERVRHKRYRLHWLAGAMWVSDGKRKVTVWDLGKYYQSPFVDALQKWGVRPDVQDDIAAMKKRRSVFTWKDIKEIRKYCFNECGALSELATALEQAHVDANLKGRSWFGPGSTASVLLNRHRIGERRGLIPPHMFKPVSRAFFGGRAEMSRNGFVPGPISGFDISSAYPYHASRLPCLEHSRWEHVMYEKEIYKRDVLHALVHGEIVDVGAVPWGPLPIRQKDARIVFPRGGASGWWWRDEWQAAREGWGGLRFERAYVLKSDCDCRPFAFLHELFDLRLKVGKDAGLGKVLKLVINSVYGKLAQTVGKPQFASRIWAGMITSGTRAQVLRLLTQHDDMRNVLMIATDGLFSREQHPVNDQITLGGWERSEYESITLVRPGIYWLGDDKIRARGLGRDNLESGKPVLAAVMRAIAGGFDVPEVWLGPKPYFGSAKLCVRPGPGKDYEHARRSVSYGQWHEKPAYISLAPAPKRLPDWAPPTLSSVESYPYGTRSSALVGEFFRHHEELRVLEY
jgi:DNA polymerase type B, organellar and viral